MIITMTEKMRRYQILATLQYRAVLPIRQLTDLIYPREWGPSVATEFHEQKAAVAWRVI